MAKGHEYMVAVLNTIDFGLEQGHLIDIIKHGDHNHFQTENSKQPEAIQKSLRSRVARKAHSLGLTSEEAINERTVAEANHMAASHHQTIDMPSTM